MFEDRLFEVIEMVRNIKQEDAPILINNDDEDIQMLAKHILQTADTDPISLLKVWIEHDSPTIPEISALQIID